MVLTVKMDFLVLVQYIAGITNNNWTLYDFIYKNKNSDQFNKALEFKRYFMFY